MNAAADYGSLLQIVKPEVAHADEQYRHMLAQLSTFLARERLGEAEEKLVELLTVLIRDYENLHFDKIEKARPVEVVRHFMEHRQMFSKSRDQKKLVRAALDYARSHTLAVIPTCSFVQAYLQKHPEEQPA